MKSFLSALCLLVLCAGSFLHLRASESDSIDVKHYTITIDTFNVSAQSIEANTELTCRSLVSGLNTFTLDLLKLTIDSIQVDGADATWTTDDTLVRVNSPTTYNAGDVFLVKVWYHGVPKKDASTFGGFYFSGTYIYNIGVAFVADPHSFGRVWFPCKDNFTDRSTYDFYIRTVNTRLAVCNGTLQSETDNGDGTTTWHWNLRDSIPTYLACMAVADYTSIRDTFVSVSGDSIPVALYMRPSDTLKVAIQFAKLHTAFDALERNYGPCRWERVGYVMVPFTGGAMEHATSIAYPTAVLPGGTAYETLWAHELSHSWFGNHVTCDSEGEMWLNEGFASYCEATFLEAAYDTASYRNFVRGNLSDVLRKTHHTDGGYFAVSGASHDNTYGSTVYDKGAVVAHTLRFYMGSTAFFEGIKDYMDDHAKSQVNSDSLKNSLEVSSGQSLDDFFDSWVYTEGFPHFGVDSFAVAPSGGSFDVTVYMRQRTKGRTTLGNSNRVQLGFKDASGNYEIRTMTFSGATASSTFTLSFSPSLVMADPDGKIGDATTDYARTVSGTAALDFPYTFMQITPAAGPDSAWYRVTHNWIAPDGFKTAMNGVRLADSRFWLVEGIVPSGYIPSAVFTYDGRNGTASSCTTCFLDDSWLTTTEDSLLIFWRANRADDWHLVSGFTVNYSGPITDKRGSITVDTLRTGEYVIGYFDYTAVSVDPASGSKPFLTLAPNPAGNEVTLHLSSSEGATAEIIDLNGRRLKQHHIPAGQSSATLSTQALADGVYLVYCTLASGKSSYTRMVIAH